MCKRGSKHYIVLGGLVVAPVVLLVFLHVKFAIFNHFPAIFLFVTLLLWGVNLLCFHLLKARTTFGQQFYGHLQGFRAFLLNPAHAAQIPGAQVPAATPNTFEYYLPYAMALDAERAWIEYYAQVFSSDHPHAIPYLQNWLTGTRLGSFNAQHLICTLNDDFANAISLAALGDMRKRDSSSSNSHCSSSSGGSGSGGGGGGGGW